MGLYTYYTKTILFVYIFVYLIYRYDSLRNAY